MDSMREAAERLGLDVRTVFLEDTRDEAREALRGIVRAYDLALKDGATKMPTFLHLALENARRVIG